MDYEGELVAIIGKRARDVALADALDHVAGYSICNDGSIRNNQFKMPPWTARKPPLFMNHGDTCEVEIDGLGVPSNPVGARNRA